MKKILIALLMCSLSVSCVAFKDGPTYLGIVGGDASLIEIPNKLTIKDLNTSIAFSSTVKAVKDMWSNYLISEGLKYVAGQYYNHEGQVLKASTSVKLEELKNAKSAADAAAKLEELKLLESTTP